MVSDKALKEAIRKKAAEDPDTYYATAVLKREGFKRQQCKVTGKFFWSTEKRETCDEPEVSGGFRFIGNTPVKEKLSYIETWQRFAAFFKERGYTPIERYPVVARWRSDTDWVQASIYDFQPYVVSGEVKPPANPLVVPQFCLRFNDIDNVGITGSHNTCFIMVGQHTFVTQNEWNQDKYFEDLLHWFIKALKIPKEELVLHEDGWAGGGNFGPCMEFFCRGLELANQVYMLYEQTAEGPKDLKLRVLDMGLGLERNAWFTQGTGTSYDATFPTVMAKLRERTNIHPNTELQKKFLPVAAYLNADEVENLSEAWKNVAGMINIQPEKLREQIEPLAALYSVAEHARALLVAIADGALPSNVGSMYNLRVLVRRALGFIDKYNWNINLPEICAWHADYLKTIFPELADPETLSNVKKILEVEKEKYEETKKKWGSTIAKELKNNITTETLVRLYDSHGISPAMVAAEAARHGKTVKVPDNFYALVANQHSTPEQATQTTRETKLDLSNIPETKILYWKDYSITKCTGTVLKIIGRNVVLDETCFYPVSGGQMHDLGSMSDIPVSDVYKQGSVIVHVLEEDPTFKEGSTVECNVNEERRRQLAQHHTATHIIGASARRVLGKHINQASAKKDTDKAYIDVTHYELIEKEQLKAIEKEANKIVNSKTEIKSHLLPRTEAEQRFTTRIYQGGAVPGNTLRIVEIVGIDAQACGGTHLNNTEEAGKIAIVKSAKVKDGVVRLYFVAGKAQEAIAGKKESRIEEWSQILGVVPEQVVARAEELFAKWKKARKATKKQNKLEESDLTLTSSQEQTTDIIHKTSEILGTQPEHVSKTLKRFLAEFEEFKKKQKEL